MQIHIFSIPTFENVKQIDEMNVFLRGHKIIDIEKQFVCNGPNEYWTFCIRYIEGVLLPSSTERREKIDYRNVLDDATFQVFSKLRVVRKQIAETNAVPAYAVFTDEELAQIAKLTEISNENMLKIKGIGLKKVEKYGLQFLTLLKDFTE